MQTVVRLEELWSQNQELFRRIFCCLPSPPLISPRLCYPKDGKKLSVQLALNIEPLHCKMPSKCFPCSVRTYWSRICCLMSVGRSHLRARSNFSDARGKNNLSTRKENGWESCNDKSRFGNMNEKRIFNYLMSYFLSVHSCSRCGYLFSADTCR